MYESFFGLTGKPFSLLPDDAFLFPSKRHRKALHLLEYGMMTEAGFIVITGEVGAGKTTILRRYIHEAERNLTIGMVTCPSALLGKLLTWVGMAFDLKTSSEDEASFYKEFVSFLVDQYAHGKRAVLVIDEAQNLSADVLEELRMLSNVNNDKDQLLQIVLVGQPELLDTLKRGELRQFVQRVSVHCHLDPIDPDETAAYIKHRLAVVGCQKEIFDDEACAMVHYFSGGMPRLINLLSDQSMVYAFAEGQEHVSAKLVAEVALDRAKGGLSAFRMLPEGKDASCLPSEIAPLVRIISKSKKVRAS